MIYNQNLLGIYKSSISSRSLTLKYGHQHPLSFLGLLACSLVAQDVAAESTIGHALVTIQEALAISENQPMSFGAISDIDGTCTMNAAGNLAGQCSGQADGAPGALEVAGTAGQVVNVTVSDGSSVDGVTLVPILNSPATMTIDHNGLAVIAVSGSLSLANATGGTKALTYIVNVNYE